MVSVEAQKILILLKTHLSALLFLCGLYFWCPSSQSLPKLSFSSMIKLEKEMATHFSTLACKIPWTEEPGGLQSMRSWRVGHNWVTSLSLFTHALEKEMAAHSSALAWRIPGTGEPGGLLSMGSHRFGHNWRDLAAAAMIKWQNKKILLQNLSTQIECLIYI